MPDKVKLDEAIDNGLSVLIKTLKKDKPAESLLKQARIASSILSTGARYEANQNSRLSMKIRVATMVLKDMDERKKYLAISSPELNLLPSPTSKKAIKEI